ncbi:MAG: hydroxypyruvate isomerase [Chloroflexi bacterium]|nr:MAG: hydroxypyruvate isomerase [Chloroflexota bacterium]
MPLRFAPNLSMLYNEVPFLERFARATAAGFETVEFLFPYEYGAPAVQRQLAEHNLRNVLFNINPGDLHGGERGTLGNPARRDFFRRSLDEALEYAAAFGCPRIHVMAGNRLPGLHFAAQIECALENLAWAAPRAASAGVTLLIEPLNATDMPGYLVQSTAAAMQIVRGASHPHVRLQYDVYHAQMTEGNLIQTMAALWPYIGHIQISDVPGRHQPGTGEINYPAIFAALERLGYEGHIGLEYRPDGETDASLAWLPREQRR